VNWAALFSPSQLNPMGVNPLRDLLERLVNFEQLRERSPFKLFVGATQASSGKLRIFRENELTVDVLLASACLPKLHHPIEIDGELYWDGGYSANPAIFPLFYECDSDDVLLVLLSPLQHDDAPHTVSEIDQRITELTFNNTFMREMQTFVRAAEFTNQSPDPNGRLERKLRSARFHMIDTSDLPSLQRTETKALPHGPFLEYLLAAPPGWPNIRARSDAGRRSTSTSGSHKDVTEVTQRELKDRTTKQAPRIRAWRDNHLGVSEGPPEWPEKRTGSFAWASASGRAIRTHAPRQIR
jgi:hypothetical protein